MGLPMWAVLLALAIGFFLVFRLLKSAPAQQSAGAPLDPNQAAANAGQPSTNTPPGDLLAAEIAGIFGLISQRETFLEQQHQGCKADAECSAGCHCRNGSCTSRHNGVHCAFVGNSQTSAAHGAAA